MAALLKFKQLVLNEKGTLVCQLEFEVFDFAVGRKQRSFTFFELITALFQLGDAGPGISNSRLNTD